MPLIGVRELRERTAEVLRSVRNDRTEYVITYQGEPIAVLLPVDEKALEEEIVDASKRNALGRWQAYDRLVKEIRESWPSDQSTQEIMDDVRR